MTLSVGVRLDQASPDAAGCPNAWEEVGVFINDGGADRLIDTCAIYFPGKGPAFYGFPGNSFAFPASGKCEVSWDVPADPPPSYALKASFKPQFYTRAAITEDLTINSASPLTLTQNPVGGLLVGTSKSVTVSGGSSGDYALMATANGACSITASDNAKGVYTVKADESGTCELTGSRAGDPEASVTVNFATRTEEQACALAFDGYRNIDINSYFSRTSASVPFTVWFDALTFTRDPSIPNACARQFKLADVFVNGVALDECVKTGPADSEFGTGETVVWRDQSKGCDYAPLPPASGNLSVSATSFGVTQQTSSTAKSKQPAVTATLGKNRLVLYEETTLSITGGGIGTLSVTTANGELCTITQNGKVRAEGSIGTCEVIVRYDGDGATEPVEGRVEAVLLAQQNLLKVTAPTAIDVKKSASFGVSGDFRTGVFGVEVVPNANEAQPRCSVSAFDGDTGAGVVQGLRAGACKLRFTKAGNAEFGDAIPVEVTFDVNKIDQPDQVSFTGPYFTGVGQSQKLNVTGGNGTGALRFSLVENTTGACQLAAGSDMINGVSPGDCTVAVYKDGDEEYNRGATTATVFTIKPAQILSFKKPSYSVSYLSEFDLSAELEGGKSTGALELTPIGNCTVDKGKVKPGSGTGSCTVKAKKFGDLTYADSNEAEATITFTKASQSPVNFSKSSYEAKFGQQIGLLALVSGGEPDGAWTFESNAPSICEVNGASLQIKGSTDSCVIRAVRSGNDNYEIATATATFNLAPATPDAPSLNFVGPYYVNDTVDLTKVTVQGATGPANPRWSYTATSAEGACEILNGDRLHLSKAGFCTVTVNQDAGGGYAATSAKYSLTVVKRPQIISWTQTLSGTYGGNPIKLSASADSKLAVSYAATGASGCSIQNNDELVLAGAGECTVTAGQRGNDEWAAATAVEKSFTIAPAAPSGFGFTADGYEVTYLTGLDLDGVIVEGPGNGTISFSADQGCTIGDGNVLSVPKGVGSCTVTASKTAGSNHLAGTDTALITFKRASSDAITLNLPANGKVGDSVRLANVTVLPARRPGNPVIYALAPNPAGACTTSEDDVLSLVAEGSCSVSASIAEDDFFTAASSNTAEIAISKKAQQIVWEQNLPDATYGDGPIELTATADSELNVTYVSADKTVCDIAGNMLELKRSGTCSVTASQDGNAEWAAATSVARSFNVLPQQVGNFSFKQESYKLAKGGTLDLRDEITGVQGSGQVTFFLMRDDAPMPTSASSDRGDGAPCSLSGSTLTANTGTGTCFVRAMLAADPDGKYEGATTSTKVTLMTINQVTTLVVKASGVLKYPGSVTLSASGGEGTGAVSFALLGGPCTLESDVLTSTGLGTCRVNATKAADADYNAVTSDSLSVVVGESLAAKASTDVVRENLFNTARNMLGYNPTTNRLNARRPGGGSYGMLAPEGTSAEGSVAFSASLQQMVQASGKGDRQVVPTSATRPDAGYNPYQRDPGALDIWLDGRFAWSNGADSEGGLDERVFMGEMGIDYLISENLLVGLSARIDTNDATIGAEGGSLDALGWMVGPYAVYEITPGLQIDARLGYGRSGNDISVITEGDSFDGSYDTTRWLAEGGVRGSFDLGEVMIEPGLRAAYYRETADAFTLDDNGGKVDEIELTMMRLAFDPRITWTHMTDEGTAFSPFISPQLVAEWQEFKGEEGAWDVYGVVEGGLTIATENYSLMGSLQASGLGGDGAMSYSAGASITIPLN